MLMEILLIFNRIVLHPVHRIWSGCAQISIIHCVGVYYFRHSVETFETETY